MAMEDPPRSGAVGRLRVKRRLREGDLERLARSMESSLACGSFLFWGKGIGVSRWSDGGGRLGGRV